MREAQILNSNAIKHILHDGTTLRVTYYSGGCYDYEDVSDELVSSMIKAEEPGRFMLVNIMPDRKGTPVVEGEPFPARG